MSLYYQDPFADIHQGDAREVLAQLPAESVQMVCCSPPYWGLRRYSGEQELVWGGQECEHEWGQELVRRDRGAAKGTTAQVGNQLREISGVSTPQGQFCQKCGAWRGGYGLEPMAELYVEHTVEMLRAIRRVLRKDGVVFWNIGDSYAGSGQGWGTNEKQQSNRGSSPWLTEYGYGKPPGFIGSLQPNGLKPKDLCLIPFRVALAAQADGWWVRSVIIWAKNNPMPESVRDRPTESHEYILMLTKSARYFWDQEAVRQPLAASSWERYEHAVSTKEEYDPLRHKTDQQGFTQSPMEVLTRAAQGVLDKGGANLRSVWSFPSQPYAGAHFATFPEELVKRCILAATPEAGSCAKCGRPWVRAVEGRQPDAFNIRVRDAKAGRLDKKSGFRRTNKDQISAAETAYDERSYGGQGRQTLGFRPACKCNAPAVPAVVLDPFCGSGTTLAVAKALGRRAIGIDLSVEYCRMSQKRVEAVSLPLVEV